MSNWEGIEKQVYRYGNARLRKDSAIVLDALANIRGIVEAMESQIPKECDHGVSMQDVCSECMLDKEPLEEPLEVDSPQNERIAQLSERIDRLEVSFNWQVTRLTGFMDQCEKNGLKREERIKALEIWRRS